MPTVPRTTAGLLLQNDFGSALSGWTDEASAWSTGSVPCFVSFDRSPNVLLGPTSGAGSAEYNGTRQGQLVIDTDGSFKLFHDAGDGVTLWRQFCATFAASDILFASPTRFALGMGVAVDGSGGTYGGGTATGWLEKRSGTWWDHRVNSDATYAPPDVGLGSSPNGYDIWKTTGALNAPWTFVLKISGGGYFPPGTGSNDNPGSVYFEGATYHAFIEARPSAYAAQREYATSEEGPYTVDSTVIVTTDAEGRTPENPKVFKYTDFGPTYYVMLLNLINSGGTFTDANAYLISTSLTDWSAATKYNFQRLCPLESTHAIGVPTHVTRPEGVLVKSADGYVPFTFDCDPRETTPGWHSGRSIRHSVLEPSPTSAHFTNTSGVFKRLSRALTNGNCTHEFAVQFSSIANQTVAFEYRLDGSNNSYRLSVRAGATLLLERMDAGTATSIGSNIGALIAGGPFLNRVKVIANGSNHKCYLDGELQFNTTDATYASGTKVAFSGKQTTGATDVRRYHARTGDAVTLAGISNGLSCILQGAGGLPFVNGTSSGGGMALAHTHYPLHSIALNGVVYTPSDGGLIWGGDTFNFATVPAGFKSLLAPWVGGAGAPSRALGGFRSLLARWVGGAGSKLGPVTSGWRVVNLTGRVDARNVTGKDSTKPILMGD